MNIAIVDDIEEHLKEFSKLIHETWEKRNNIELLTTFKNVMDLYPVISKYDVVFMDIKMPEKDGITAAKELGELSPKLIIVFLSDYDSYVWNSFLASPIYFLRKSCLADELPVVVDKCIETYIKRHKTIIIDRKSETYRCNADDIYYVEAQGKNTSLHFVSDIKILKTTFSNVEKTLNNMPFLKIHRSYLVNCSHIRSLQNKQVILDNDEVLPVSKYRYDSIHKQYLMSLI
ncbi:MAG: LytTR family DNA-binding domain-containing protein [Ruminococcus flavefaciens]|nr:LytTR family DNA-binding domain-containing protein [Ruminococcus flavefaciens]